MTSSPQRHYTLPGQSQADVGTTKQSESATNVTPSVTNPPHSVALTFKQLIKIDVQPQVNVGPTTQAQSSSLHHVDLAEPASNVGPLSPTLLPEPVGDEMPSGRMRGSLQGNQLEAARLQYLAPPIQLVRANQPWSKPTPTNPIPLLMQRPPGF